MAAAPLQYDPAVVEKGLQRLLQVHDPRHAKRVEHVEIERDPHLEVGRAEQLLHQHFGVDIAGLRFEDEANILGQLVPDVGEERQLLLFEQPGDLLDEPALLHLERHLGDDDLVEAVPQRFRGPTGAQPKAAAAGLIALPNCFGRLDQDTAGWEIGSGYAATELLDRAGGMVDQIRQCGAKLADIVRRNAGRHADRNARRAVGEQVWKPGGKDDGLAVFAVIGRPEIDSVLVDPFEHRLRNGGEPALRVAHRRGVIAVDVAEISLTVDQRIALRKILRETDQRVVDRQLAMRVKLADDVADDACAFLVAGSRVKPQLMHRVHNSPVHRLQAVAHIRQRARHDRRQRIGQIALAERIGEVDIADLAGKGRNRHKSISKLDSGRVAPLLHRGRGCRAQRGG